jgi:hypothetical protein
MVRPALDGSIVALRRALRGAGVSAGEVTAVLLVGGSSRVPLVAEMVGSELGRPVATDAHPKYGVALGAAIVAAGRDVADAADRSEVAAVPEPPRLGGVAAVAAAPVVPPAYGPGSAHGPGSAAAFPGAGHGPGGPGRGPGPGHVGPVAPGPAAHTRPAGPAPATGPAPPVAAAAGARYDAPDRFTSWTCGGVDMSAGHFGDCEETYGEEVTTTTGAGGP